ncbi:MAG TPA: DUF805 domain-containing protein [Longimicrobiales bacterium]|nr:DUF805 domain-containing protein [Longimicrobiales bacterium]
MEWYLKVLRDYAKFDGRAHRQEYWMFFLINLLIMVGISIVESVLGSFGIVGIIYGLAVLIPGLAVGVRRLHDTGRSGWWLLIGLIPVIGVIVLLVFLVQDSEPGPNQFGPNPKATVTPAPATL